MVRSGGTPPSKKAKHENMSSSDKEDNNLTYTELGSESTPPSKEVKHETMSFSDEEDNNLTYTELREKRMKENMDMFEELGVNQAAKSLASSIKKDVNKKKTMIDHEKDLLRFPSIAPTRRSERIANIHDHLIEANDSFKEPSFNPVKKVFLKNSIPIPKEDSTFFKKLHADIVVKDVVNDFHKCDFDKFSNVVKSLEIQAPTTKVTETRIYSLAIHPTEASLTVAIGDMKGTICLCCYSYPNPDMRRYQVHDAPVNCVSFCTWDPHKLFSTSHDGTVRCGDIVKCTFDIIFKSNKKKMEETHTTWHTEYGRNLLIGHGSGHVYLIDLRTPKGINNSIWCHEKSVRTVQCHPLENHYFLTSSGSGSASLFDLRKMSNITIDPVLKFDHPKALTSAFFSGTGINMVSTCNDDHIRVFNTSRLIKKATKPVTSIPHENHTGRWLSVFKAKWNPGRDDAFFVGSLQRPYRTQIYRADGSLLHNLRHQLYLSAYYPVIEVHPTQPIYVIGNASGRILKYSIKDQL